MNQDVKQLERNLEEINKKHHEISEVNTTLQDGSNRLIVANDIQHSLIISLKESLSKLLSKLLLSSAFI